MMPVRLTGDSVPALAPTPTMSASRNAGTPAATPADIASGAMIATPAIAPGPIAASVKVSRKNATGRIAVRWPQSRTIRAVITASVPLRTAIPKRSVTPTRMRNSGAGNDAANSLAVQPAANRATPAASVIASTPTLMRAVMLTPMTIRSAPSERMAGLIGAASQ